MSKQGDTQASGSLSGIAGGKPLRPASHDGVPKFSKYPRLSRPVALIRPEYEVVVIGSGYGGGVAASKMARAGKSVAVLELGKERWPGEFPSNLKDAAPNVHISGELGKSMGRLRSAKLGGPTGLYHLILGEGQNAFVGNGLGGTSLLNANIFLECDKRTLALSDWPEEIREGSFALDKYYKAAAKMLTPESYPESYPALHKLSVLEEQAKAVGQEQNFYRPPQTTFFHNGLNSAGVEMKASTGSGQDSTGINDGSKNTVLVTYIADAWNWGAEIFCECEVRYIEKDPHSDGYIIFYAWHGNDREAFKNEFYSQLMWVRAKELCFLGAGALGTTEILLRSQAHGLHLSPMVGQKVSGNGDILSFGYNTDKIVNGVGSETPSKSDPCGPTITGVIDNRGPETSANVLDGHVIQEGAIPSALAAFMQPILELLPGKTYPKPNSLPRQLRHLLSRTQNRLLGPYSAGSSVNRMQTYLVMSHDSNEGIVSLIDDKPYLQFLGVGRTEHVQEVHRALERMTSAVGGTLINSPFYAAFHQQEEITVHPLGGVVMSADGTGKRGATNHLGQLFTTIDDKVHTGLVCVDGSIIPTALGVNPLATITALAERSVDALAQARSLSINQTANGKLDLFGHPARAFDLTPAMAKASNIVTAAKDNDSVRFTELMEGYVHIGDDIDDTVVAENVARGSSSAARLYLSVDIYDVDAMIKYKDHAALATGTFACGALSAQPLLILEGRVRFFVPDDAVSEADQVLYELTLMSTSGDTYLLTGTKKLDASMSFSVTGTWKATTTLYTTLTRLDGSLVGKGTLTISWRNFKSELKTIGPVYSAKKLSFQRGVPSYLGFFASHVFNLFLRPFGKLYYPKDAIDKDGFFDKVGPVVTETITASDGVQTVIKTWKSQTGSARDTPLLLIPGASVNDQIYSLPTISTNAVEYLTSHGFTVYIPTPRFGITPVAREGYTAYDARHDIVAAAQYVRNRNENKKIYVVCHCLGAIATSMALLDGSLPAEWIKGMTVSQVFFKQQFGTVNSLKLGLGPATLPKAYKILAGSWYPTLSSPSSPLLQVLLDQLLRFYPVGARDEICSSTVCHRCSLCYGRLWSHDKLNRATHAHLDRFLGGVDMRFLAHLTTMGYGHDACDNGFRSLVTEANLERFRGLKILFLSGGANVVFDPESTAMSYDVLRDRFGTKDYRRTVFAGYGHLDTWMGKRSFLDVYPSVLEHINETT